MWECDFKTPEIFSKIVPWFQLNHGTLSVLVHPRIDSTTAFLEHTQYAFWMGDKVKLVEEVLKNE